MEKIIITDTHSFSTEEVFKKLNVNSDIGLSTAEVKERQQLYGKNDIEQKKKKKQL